MSTHRHQQLGEHHAGQAGSHADAKVRYTMEAVQPVVSELLTANPRSPDHETWLLTRAIAARRNRQRVDDRSMRPPPITAAVKWSPKIGYTVGIPTLYVMSTVSKKCSTAKAECTEATRTE